MDGYIPSPRPRVAKQVELYERSGGVEGTTLKELGVNTIPSKYHSLPVIIVTNIGHRTGAIRKTPLMKVVHDNSYVLVASLGGAPKNPLWYYNLLKTPEVTIRDNTKVHSMIAVEIVEERERGRLWDIAVKAYPPYHDYQSKTDRLIPVFLASRSS
jgi:deazaflavin-dependent oxidoreductase (nitroreductase family)